MIEFRRADRAQQNSVGGQAGVQRCRRQRRSRSVNRDPARLMFFEMKVVAVNVCYFAQNMDGLRGHFRANPVTGKNDYFQLHAPS